MRPAKLARDVVDWALHTEGSSRPAGLMRCGLGMLVWARYGSEMILYRDLSPERVALSCAFMLLSTLMVVGLWSRTSTAGTAGVLAVMYFHIGHGQGYVNWLHHHNYLLLAATVLCALTPCDRSYSLDRVLAIRRAHRTGACPAPVPPERGNLWGHRLIALQLSAIYFWGAYDKSFVGFLDGDRLEHYLMFYYLDSDYPQWTGFRALMTTLGTTTVVLEYVLAVGLFIPRLRTPVLIAGVLMHLVFYVLLSVVTFSLNMILLYLAVIDADRTHRFIDELHGVSPERASP